MSTDTFVRTGTSFLSRRGPRSPTAGLVAGNLVPVDSFRIAADWAASAYPADVWLSLSTAEQSAAIYREMRKLDMAYAAPSSVE